MAISRASQPLNPWIGVSYVDDNRRMDVPPAWFLQQLHDYDGDLVLLPSRARPFAYVIARRARLSGGLTPKAMERTITQPDTKMCWHYGLVPICLMFKHGPVWNVDGVLRTLKARDTWAHGGGDKMADAIEAAEAKDVETRRAQQRDEIRHLSVEAYRSYKRRTGQRVTSGGVDPSRFGAATKGSSSSTATGIALTDWSPN